MDTLIVYLDDAAYAQHQLVPLMDGSGEASKAVPTRWILVACAPRMSRRIGKWLSHSARENWRERWSAKLFAQICPVLQAPQNSVHTVIANGPLPDLTHRLRAEFGDARVLDARRPKFGTTLEPVVQGQPDSNQAWQVPAAVTGLGVALILAGE